MELIYGRPFQGAMLEQLKAFLQADGLRYDEGVEFTVCVMDGDKIAATGSLDGKICKCIAVSPAYQGEGLSATVLTALRKEAFDRSQRHLFLYTKNIPSLIIPKAYISTFVTARRWCVAATATSIVCRPSP